MKILERDLLLLENGNDFSNNKFLNSNSDVADNAGHIWEIYYEGIDEDL